MINYIVCPGHVDSEKIGAVKHFISFQQLVNLYCVDPKECECYAGGEPARFNLLMRTYPDAVWLHPRKYGDYGRWLADRRPK